MNTRFGRRVGVLAASFAMAVGTLSVGISGVSASPLSGALAAKGGGGGIDSCGYNDATFNESEILYGIGVFGSGFGAHVGMFVSDEKGLSLGVNGATPNTADPQHVSSPSLGDLSQKDPSGRYFAPVIYVTDVTNDPSSKAGDWQSGGTANTHVDDVYGVWSTGKITNGSYQIDVPPAGQNGATPGAGSDPAPAGQPIEKYNAEVAWNVQTLHDQNGNTLQPGHTYRFQVIGHDGDQNKSGGDAGEACATLAIPGQGLHARKVVDKAQASPGDVLTYTITVTNPDPVDVTGVDISDDISSIVPGHGTHTSSTPNATVTGGNQLSWSGQTVPANGSLTFTYKVTLANGGWPAGQTTLPNVVVVTKSNCTAAPNQDPDCHTTTIVTPTPDLTVTKTADNASVPAGSQIGFTITASNTGNTTLPSVTLSDPLPTIAGLGITWSVASSSPVGTCSVAGLNLTCNFGDLASGASASVHVTSPTTAPAGGGGNNQLPSCTIQVKGHNANLDNTATVTTGNTTRTDRDGICVTGNPHLVVTKTPDAQTVVAGSQVGFTITVKNDGIGSADNVLLNDPLPTLAGLGISWSINPAYTGPGSCAINGAAASQTLNCPIGSLASGASTSVHVSSPTTAPAGGQQIAACQITVTNFATNLDNSVNVTSSNAGSATAQTGVCVTANPHISVVKTPDNTSVLAGNPVGFTMTVKSDGSGTATAVTLSDPLPTLANAGLSWSISPAFAGPGACSISGAAPSPQTLNCSFGDLASGQTASVHVTSPTTAPANGGAIAPCQVTVVTYATNLNNAVQVTSTNAQSASSQTGICVSISPQPAIHVVKKANPTVLPVGGGPVTYTYAVTNVGNVPLSNVTAVDDKCSPLVFLGGDTNNDARLDLTETWNYSCTATITVTTTNTVVATGHYIDPNDPAHTDHTVTDKDQATVVVPVPTPTPTGSVKGATSPPKVTITLPPTDASDPLGTSGGQSGLLMIFILLAGIVAAVPILAFGKRRQVRR